jgi:hypothetical protein
MDPPVGRPTIGAHPPIPGRCAPAATTPLADVMPAAGRSPGHDNARRKVGYRDHVYEHQGLDRAIEPGVLDMP